MKTKHIFVPALDIGEILPFLVKKTKNLNQNFKEQDKAKKNLVKFIDKLEKNLKQPVYYIGFDIIGEKAYERFIFDKGGFFEIMIEAPLALNAHFVHNNQAKVFLAALKKTLTSILPKTDASKMFIENINIQDESEDSLTVAKWHQLKDIRTD